jgi:hypothetical protein
MESILIIGVPCDRKDLHDLPCANIYNVYRISNFICDGHVWGSIALQGRIDKSTRCESVFRNHVSFVNNKTEKVIP